MAAYAAMVAEASQARPVPAPAAPASPPARAPQQPPTAENPRLASAAQWLDSTRAGRRQAGTRQTEPAYAVPPSRAGRAPDGLDRQTARLARALGADARRLADRAVAASRPVARRARETTPAPLSAGALQEQVLADLMLHPAGRGDITSWLPATVFAARQQPHPVRAHQPPPGQRTAGRPADHRLGRQRARRRVRPRRPGGRAPGRRRPAPGRPEPRPRHRRCPRPGRSTPSRYAPTHSGRTGGVNAGLSPCHLRCRLRRRPGPDGRPRTSRAGPGSRPSAQPGRDRSRPDGAGSCRAPAPRRRATPQGCPCGAHPPGPAEPAPAPRP